MGKVMRYFIPKRKLYQVPRHISADYDRSRMTRQQSILMMAGYARDPQHAQRLLEELEAAHGRNLWQQVQFVLKRPFDKTFWQRLLILFRRAFGESDSPVPRYRKRRSQEPIAWYRYSDD